MKHAWKHLTAVILLLGLAANATAQQSERVELLPYGDFDQWLVREIEESFIIGGNTKYLYEVAPGDTLRGNTPYKSSPGSPWPPRPRRIITHRSMPASRSRRPASSIAR